MTRIAGSLWSIDHDHQVPAALRLKEAGLRRLHWDMSDGLFAAVGGFSATRALEITNATGLSAEAHLMANQPLSELDPWTEFCDLVIVHAETADWRAAVDKIAARGATPGVAISPGTPPSVVPEGLTTLCMSITPGQAGSRFDPAVLQKVRYLHARSHRVGIDGGVRRELATGAVAAGADWLVVGTDLFLGDGATRWSDLLPANGS